MKISKTRTLVECAIMIALATVLSLIKIIDLPYGGSVTAASMLPIILVAYRHGTGAGLASGLVYGIIQQLLGLNTLSYVTTWQSVIAVVMLDYILAFLVIGLGGIFRKAISDQAASLVTGSIFVCLLRYICHVISGATVWAGLSIPTTGAVVYSLAYNATYMIPETLVLVVVGYYFSSLIDFRGEQPKRLVKTGKPAASLPAIAGGLILAAAAVFDIVKIFSKVQNAETGDWDAAGLTAVDWKLVAIVTCAATVVSVILFAVGKKMSAKSEKA